MELHEKERVVADFVGMKEIYNPLTLKFSSDFNWLIRAVRKYLDIDYATVKNSESIDLVRVYKIALRERSAFTDDISDIFDLLVEGIMEYNKIKR